MKAKIRVYGKDQNRTALGIINAYLKLYPNATLADVQKAFPDSLNPASAIKEIVVPISEAATKPNEFFLKPEEIISFKNGQKAAVKYVWTKDNLEAIIERAKQFGIKAEKVADTPPFKNGSYSLEWIDKTSKPIVTEGIIIDDFVPEGEIIVLEEEPVVRKNVASCKAPIKDESKKKKCCKGWWWWLLLLLALLLLLLCWKKCSNKENVIPATEITSSTALEGEQSAIRQFAEEYIPYRDKRLASGTLHTTDTMRVVYSDGDLITIKLNNLKKNIQVGSLSSEAELYHILSKKTPVFANEKEGWITLDKTYFKFNQIGLDESGIQQLKNIAAILEEFPNAKIAIAGFSDSIGTSEVNMTVSKERAMEVKNLLVKEGVPADRIVEVKGFGEQYPVCVGEDPLCRAKNRRIDIKVTDL